jgi:hypothetical protein
MCKTSMVCVCPCVYIPIQLCSCPPVLGFIPLRGSRVFQGVGDRGSATERSPEECTVRPVLPPTIPLPFHP